MGYQFTVSPDFPPDKLSGWFIFNTWLQRRIGEGIHLEIYDSFHGQRDAISAGRVDLIYANPYDAAMLVRDRGFAAVARPSGRGDEAVIAVRTDAAARRVEDLAPGIRVASTDDPDVNMLGMILLEPADLHAGNIVRTTCDAYVLVAKQLLKGEADVGIFLAEAFDALSPLIRNELSVLVRSQISVVQHMMMIGPKFRQRRGDIADALVGMGDDLRGRTIVSSLGIPGWTAVTDEDVEFMIDLIDTLAFETNG